MIDPDSIPAGWGYVPSNYHGPSQHLVSHKGRPQNQAVTLQDMTYASSRLIAPRGSLHKLVMVVVNTPYLLPALRAADLHKKYGLSMAHARYIIRRARHFKRIASHAH